MVSNAVKEVTEQDRRKQLAAFLYDMAKLMFGSVAVGGMSPLFTGNLKVSNMGNWDIAGGWFLFNVLMLTGTLVFAIFLHTKRGKKWMEDL